jgi:hypothetical protein
LKENSKTGREIIDLLGVFFSLLVFDGNQGAGCRFNVLRSRSRFPRYRGRLVTFSSFACPDSFLVVPRASGPVFMFCVLDSLSTIPRATSSVFMYITVPRSSGPAFMFYAPGLVFGGTERVRSRFHVLRSRTYFWQNHGHRVSFSCFAHPDSFSAVPRASGPIFMFCAPILIFGGTEDVQSCFHVLRSWTHFRRYGRLRVPFSCFARPDSFSTETRVPGCRFHVLRSRSRFPRYRGRQVTFSSFARPDSFSTVPRVSGPVFMFCAPGHVFYVVECVGSRFHVLCAQTHFRRSRGRQVLLSCFFRCRGRRVSFSCFARPKSFSTETRVLGAVVPWYRGRHVTFSCFAHLDSFSAVLRSSGPVLLFCAPGHVFSVAECVGYRFHVLCVQTHFRRYRGRPVLFSSFALPD